MGSNLIVMSGFKVPIKEMELQAMSLFVFFCVTSSLKCARRL